MLDRDESALHAVELMLNGRAMLDQRNLVVADVRDAPRLIEVFEEWQPEVVFHAAALKHLPLLEMHPNEGVKTNVHGTLNVLSAAAKVGVSRFVNVSTDKAADPTSVLGYTKRIAERLTAWFSGEQDGTFVSVRFGNVLGSRGSFLTAFRQQIQDGSPVTVTHRDVTRYFMTVEEAVSLIIQAGALGRDGEALVLDMGDPVRIRDVAERMIQVSGKPLEIDYTGLRQGEKLNEVLLGVDEVDDRPSHILLSQAPVLPLDPSELDCLDAEGDLIDPMIGLCANRARRWSPAVALGDDVILDLTAPRSRIRLAEPVLGDEELSAVKRVFASGYLTNGPETKAFETAFANLHEVEHAVALANGTIALQAMLLALDIGPGDEVIVPSMTFIATATSVVHVGATPVFADIQAETFNLDPNHVRQLVTPHTRAIIAVHYGGQPADLDELAAIAQDTGVHLLEDAAQAHGASYRGRMVGGIGQAGMFSFTPTKNITTGEGAILTTNDSAIAKRVRLLRNHAMSEPYRHEFVGYNWRMTEMQAAIGCVQLSKLGEILRTKRSLALAMGDRLRDVAQIECPVARTDRDHVYMLYTCKVTSSRDTVMRALQQAGIESRVYFPPIHRQPAFRHIEAQLPVTEQVATQILSLPLHARMDVAAIREVAAVVEHAADSVALVAS
jgi:perosamine synthetase